MRRSVRLRLKATQPGREWADRLRQERLRAGLSQTALADGIHKSQSTVAEYESGKAEPDLSTFTNIATVLGTTASWLAFGQPDDGEADGDVSDASPPGEEEDRLFAWTLYRAAKLLADEGLDGDLTFLTLYTRKILRLAQSGADDAEVKELILRTIEKERAEFRQRKNDIKKNAL